MVISTHLILYLYDERPWQEKSKLNTFQNQWFVDFSISAMDCRMLCHSAMHISEFKQSPQRHRQLEDDSEEDPEVQSWVTLCS